MTDKQRKTHLANVADLMLVFVIFLLALSIGLQAWHFNAYISEAAESRALICEAPVLRSSEYCEQVRDEPEKTPKKEK